MAEQFYKPSLGDRMKAYEGAYRDYIPTSAYIVVRVDGRAFSGWTKRNDINKPIDYSLAELFRFTVDTLAQEIGSFCIAAYTQSDEATFVLSPRVGIEECRHYFDGNVQKITSTIVSSFTATFNKFVSDDYSTATFDARTFSVPSLKEVANNLLWRMKDAERNWVSASARYQLGHKQTQGLNSSQMIEQMGDSFDPLEGLGYLRIGKPKSCKKFLWRPTWDDVIFHLENYIDTNTSVAYTNLPVTEYENQQLEELRTAAQDWLEQYDWFFWLPENHHKFLENISDGQAQVLGLTREQFLAYSLYKSGLKRDIDHATEKEVPNNSQAKEN